MITTEHKVTIAFTHNDEWCHGDYLNFIADIKAVQRKFDVGQIVEQFIDPEYPEVIIANFSDIKVAQQFQKACKDILESYGGFFIL